MESALKKQLCCQEMIVLCNGSVFDNVNELCLAEGVDNDDICILTDKDANFLAATDSWRELSYCVFGLTF